MVFCNDAYGRHYEENQKSHNPYFNRWFSAMLMLTLAKNLSTVTILILIDGFLQYELHVLNNLILKWSQSLF